MQIIERQKLNEIFIQLPKKYLRRLRRRPKILIDRYMLWPDPRNFEA